MSKTRSVCFGFFAALFTAVDLFQESDVLFVRFSTIEFAVRIMEVKEAVSFAGIEGGDNGIN